ncbi:MAG: FtsX-like permease family protein, partial [Acidimicrobiales bacterium]
MLVRLMWKSIVQRPLRYVLTGLAILFGVASVSAVFIFTDGLRSTFDELAGNIEDGYDIAVQPRIEFGDGFLAPTVPLDHLQLVEQTPGVAAVQPRIAGFGIIAIDADDEPAFAASGPNLGVHWGVRSGVVRLFLQEGRRPEKSTEFAVDIDTFAEGNFTLGDQYRVQVPAPLPEGTTFTLVGTFTFADPDENALVGARLVAFDEDTAVELINQGKGYTDITLILKPDADPLQVIADLEAVVDDNLEVRTREEIVEATQDQFGDILGIFRTVLLVFAIIILGVSSFLIYNVFSITLGQRIRELGLLRAIGALGSQITQLMIGEALLLGIAGTIVGLPAGMGLAWLLRAALKLLGFPDDTGLPLAPLTVVWAIVTGVVVTVLAAIWPSIQARRVSPMAALRDGANLTDLADSYRPLRGLVTAFSGCGLILGGFTFSGWLPRLFLPVVGGIVVYVGVLLISKRAAKFVMFTIGIILLLVTLRGDFELGETFGLLGAGALLTLLGANQLNPYFARPAVRLLGSTPTAVVLGLIGIVMSVAVVGAFGFGIYVLATGVPQGIQDSFAEADVEATRGAIATPLLFISVLLSPLPYGLIRTSLGARGLTGRVGRANASRNPQRTATTAAALMIGLTLVTAVTVIGDSIKSSVNDALGTSIIGDFLVQGPVSGPSRTPFSVEVSKRLSDLDEIESIVPYRAAFPAAFATSDEGELTAADFQEFLPQILQLINPDNETTPQDLLALQAEIGTSIDINDALAVDFTFLEDHVDPGFISIDRELIGPDSVYIVDEFAEEKGLEVGDSFPALFVDLQSEDLVVAGIYTNQFVLGQRVISIDMWNRHFPSDSDQFLTVVTAPGISEDVGRAAIEAALEEDFPIIEALTKDEFAANAERQINQTLATVNVLLGLAA